MVSAGIYLYSFFFQLTSAIDCKFSIITCYNPMVKKPLFLPVIRCRHFDSDKGFVFHAGVKVPSSNFVHNTECQRSVILSLRSICSLKTVRFQSVSSPAAVQLSEIIWFERSLTYFSRCFYRWKWRYYSMY